ncbi:class I SAM-dependent methyltransferase [uncultured Subdoligranulum sp.]|uniref:class I SAM-dependent methyltransferase n=2 Tax=uncultured Subdoligranulum sp. TaxID=512298 RepID=UPI0025D9F5DD|nr:class I SAM-dependent methyltransferase [uncultured Subdoligranulum sp.]
MEIRCRDNLFTLYKEHTAIGTARLEGDALWVEIDPVWRRRGYGSYLVKEVLRRQGGLDPKRESRFTVPLPGDEAARALAAKFGFVPAGDRLVRRRMPDLSAVQLCHEFLTTHLAPGGFYLDATCGNGHDTEFLCRLAGPSGRVLGLDIQPAAVQATNARLAAAGLDGIGRAILQDHARLGEVAAPGTADCVLFNFGWLPGADHGVHSTAAGSIPALQAALTALKPRGVLAAVLYSGQVIGDGEKQAALDFFRALPLTRYTVLVCEFANWASTAPLPCFVLKR